MTRPRARRPILAVGSPLVEKARRRTLLGISIVNQSFAACFTNELYHAGWMLSFYAQAATLAACFVVSSGLQVVLRKQRVACRVRTILDARRGSPPLDAKGGSDVRIQRRTGELRRSRCLSPTSTITGSCLA